MTHNLSKSKILSGMQCPKRLWLEVYRPDLAEYAQGLQAILDTGRKVGEIACAYLAPGGVFVSLDQGFDYALEMTRKHLDSSTAPLYEATFTHDRVLIRSDIVSRSISGLQVTEVKASTKVKDYHLWDCAVQLWVLRRAGYPVQEMQVAVIDSTFVYPGGDDYHGLLRTEDVTQQALEMQAQAEEWISKCKSVLNGSMPDIGIGSHCGSPFDCPFQGYCTPEDGPEYPLECLPRISARLHQELSLEGYRDIRDIPQGRLKKENQERVRRVTVSGQSEVLPGATEILNNQPYPRYFLDFETIQFAVPIWEGTRPYQQLPFQWSCHVEQEPGVISHLEFLDLSGNPPMRGFAESLISACGESGPIFVYASFEARIIRELIQQYPDLTGSLEDILERIVDLLPIVRQHYYHPQMHGSWSLKAVLPCLAPELDYSSLDEVQDGNKAQEAYSEAIAQDLTSQRKEEIRQELSAYCKMDTLALVRIVEALTS